MGQVSMPHGRSTILLIAYIDYRYIVVS
jgi:hypothetical protein